MSERERLEAEIDATREHLAETVDALGDKFDVKKQAQRNQGRLLTLAACAAVAAVGVVLFRRG